MNLVSMWVEVEHNTLLHESVLIMNLGSNFVEVLIDALLDKDGATLDQVYMLFDVLEC